MRESLVIIRPRVQSMEGNSPAQTSTRPLGLGLRARRVGVIEALAAGSGAPQRVDEQQKQKQTTAKGRSIVWNHFVKVTQDNIQTGAL